MKEIRGRLVPALLAVLISGCPLSATAQSFTIDGEPVGQSSNATGQPAGPAGVNTSNYLTQMRGLIDRYNGVLMNLVIGSTGASKDPEAYKAAAARTQQLANDINAVKPPASIAAQHGQLAASLGTVNSYLNDKDAGQGGMAKALSLAGQVQSAISSYHQAVQDLISQSGLPQSMDPFAGESDANKQRASSALGELQNRASQLDADAHKGENRSTALSDVSAKMLGGQSGNQAQGLSGLGALMGGTGGNPGGDALGGLGGLGALMNGLGGGNSGGGAGGGAQGLGGLGALMNGLGGGDGGQGLGGLGALLNGLGGGGGNGGGAGGLGALMNGLGGGDTTGGGGQGAGGMNSLMGGDASQGGSAPNANNMLRQMGGGGSQDVNSILNGE